MAQPAGSCLQALAPRTGAAPEKKWAGDVPISSTPPGEGIPAARGQAPFEHQPHRRVVHQGGIPHRGQSFLAHTLPPSAFDSDDVYDSSVPTSTPVPTPI